MDNKNLNKVEINDEVYIYYNGVKYEYKIFLMDTQIAVHFKIDLMDYMRKNLPELIKEYLINKLKKLEELANE